MPKYISSRDLRNRTGDVWKTLKETKEVVISSNGKPVAILVDVDDEDDLEERLKDIRTARAGRALENMQMQAAKNGMDKLSDEEIEEEIQKTRQERK